MSTPPLEAGDAGTVAGGMLWDGAEAEPFGDWAGADKVGEACPCEWLTLGRMSQ